MRLLLALLLISPAAMGAVPWSSALKCSAAVIGGLPHDTYFLNNRNFTGEYLFFQPENSASRANLTNHFMFHDQFSDLVEPINANKTFESINQLKRLAKEEWEIRKDDLLYSINYGMMRGPLLLHQRNIHSLDPDDFATLLLDPAKQAVETVYAAYAAQGPERALLVPAVRKQDLDESSRYVRVVLNRFVKPLGYLQILLSRKPSERLHVEEAWGLQVAGLVRKSPGEVVGEFGRLLVVHPNDYHSAYHREHIDELKSNKGKREINKMINYLLLQKALAYVNSDARLDRLLIQINKGVEAVMKMHRIPIHLGEHRDLTKVWPSGEAVTEVVYSFDRAALLRMEEIIMRQVLRYWLEYARDHALFRAEPFVMFKFYANEIAVLRRLGIFSSFGGDSLPADADGEVRVGIHTSDVPRLISLLETPE